MTSVVESSLASLRQRVTAIGKPEWRPMLAYVADLHARSIHPAASPLPFDWEDIGPGYCYGPAFGHWDIIHAVLDVMASEPIHAEHQLLNNLATQQADGLVPGSIWMRENPPGWDHNAGHPPVWPYAVDDLFTLYPERAALELQEYFYNALIRQIGWFEQNRAASPAGFYYTDILNHTWESGVDDGIRFLGVKTGPLACVDASAHVLVLYEAAVRWGQLLRRDVSPYAVAAQKLKRFIQNELYNADTRFFHDIWSVNNPQERVMSIEGAWPMITGAATEEQAAGVIENLLDPKLFLSTHPLTTVAMTDPRFELRMWRGPAWNSMTYWAARGCMRYQHSKAARILLEMSLDQSARRYARTSTIWEFYHPFGGDPALVTRKPYTQQNTPCRDYLGHNPLIAMALLWERAQAP